MKIGLRVNKGDKEYKRVEDATVEIGIGGGASSKYNNYLETCNAHSPF
jgi:hypothetical protein